MGSLLRSRGGRGRGRGYGAGEGVARAATRGGGRGRALSLLLVLPLPLAVLVVVEDRERWHLNGDGRVDAVDVGRALCSLMMAPVRRGGVEGGRGPAVGGHGEGRVLFRAIVVLLVVEKGIVVVACGGMATSNSA